MRTLLGVGVLCLCAAFASALPVETVIVGGPYNVAVAEITPEVNVDESLLPNQYRLKRDYYDYRREYEEEYRYDRDDYDRYRDDYDRDYRYHGHNRGYGEGFAGGITIGFGGFEGGYYR